MDMRGYGGLHTWVALIGSAHMAGVPDLIVAGCRSQLTLTSYLHLSVTKIIYRIRSMQIIELWTWKVAVTH
eukprot:6196907-Pleurochrysis_carterae.AAC.3